MMLRSSTALQRVCRPMPSRCTKSRMMPPSSVGLPQLHHRFCAQPAAARGFATSNTSASGNPTSASTTTAGVGIGDTVMPTRIKIAEEELGKLIEEEKRQEDERIGYHRLLTDTETLAQTFVDEMKRILPPETFELLQKCFIQIDHTNFEKEILNSKGPVLYEIYSEFQLPCKLMRPFLRESVLSRKGKIRLAYLDFDKYRNQVWLVQLSLQNQHPEFGIYGFPTVFAVLDGKVVGKLTGYHNAQEVETFIQKSFGNLA